MSKRLLFTRMTRSDLEINWLHRRFFVRLKGAVSLPQPISCQASRAATVNDRASDRDAARRRHRRSRAQCFSRLEVRWEGGKRSQPYETRVADVSSDACEETQPHVIAVDGQCDETDGSMHSLRIPPFNDQWTKFRSMFRRMTPNQFWTRLTMRPAQRASRAVATAQALELDCSDQTKFHSPRQRMCASLGKSLGRNSMRNQRAASMRTAAIPADSAPGSDCLW
jgi:hypothetical protein